MGPTGIVNLVPSNTAHTRVSLDSSGAEISTSGPKNCSYPLVSGDETWVGWFTTAEDTPSPGADDNSSNRMQAWVRNTSTGTAYLASGANWTLTGRTGPGDGPTSQGSLSGNGRFLVFGSGAGNFQVLINGTLQPDDNWVDDVWMYDTQNFELARLSCRPVNGVGGGARSWAPGGVSEQGRWVTFMTDATNLVTENTIAGNCTKQPRGGGGDVVLLDRGQSDLPVHAPGAQAARKIYWVSHGIVVQYQLPGGQPYILDCVQPNGPSDEPSMSAGGCKIVYLSQATNLSLHDPFTPADDPIWHVYVYDRTTGLNELVSKSTSGTRANDDCSSPRISADGRYVVYTSGASTLDPLNKATALGVPDVYVRDLIADTTHLVTYAQDGTVFTGTGYSGSRFCSISPGGRFITYGCGVGDPSTGFQLNPAPFSVVVLLDRDADTNGQLSTTFASSEIEVQYLRLEPQGGFPNSATAAPLMFGAQGEFAYFGSDADNLISGDTNGLGQTGRDIFKRRVWQ